MKRTETFGYTYPETAGLQYPVSRLDKVNLQGTIDDLYPSAPRMMLLSKSGDTNAGEDLLAHAQLLNEIVDKQTPATATESTQLISQLPDHQTLLTRSLEPSKPFLKDLAPENKYLEWLVNIKAEKHALDGNYSIHVFLGAVQDDEVALWSISPHHVGTFAPFGQGSDTECGKCQEDQREHLQITDQIPLTLALMERFLAGMIPDIGSESVVPYLKENLHWRVVHVSYLHPETPATYMS